MMTRSMLKSALTALVTITLCQHALAADETDETEAEAAEAEEIEVIYTDGKSVGLGLHSDFQLPMLSPDQLQGTYGASLLLGANFGWLSMSAFTHGPSLKGGLLWVRGKDTNTARGNDLEKTVFLGSVGYGASFFFSDSWTFNQSLHVPFTAGGPGIQLDLGVTGLPGKFLGLHTAFDMGTQLTVLQTGVAAANKEDVNWLALGLYLNVRWELWGKYNWLPADSVKGLDF